MTLKVYLAGRITGWHQDWRYPLMAGAPYMEWNWGQGHSRAVESIDEDDYDVSMWIWNQVPSVIPEVSVTGPFFIQGEGHDGMHGESTHGVDGPYPDNGFGYWPDVSASNALSSSHSISSGGLSGTPRGKRVWQLCQKAIRDSDLVFAYLDSLDAYGTLMEIGYARGIGKPVVICVQQHFTRIDAVGPSMMADLTADEIAIAQGQYAENRALHAHLWLTLEAATYWADVYDRSQMVDMFVKICEQFLDHRITFQSPAEESLWREYVGDRKAYPHLRGMRPQVPVGTYLLDFGRADIKQGVEINGLAYHGKEQADWDRDHKRRRFIQRDGWVLTEFTAKEALGNPGAILRELNRLWEPAPSNPPSL